MKTEIKLLLRVYSAEIRDERTGKIELGGEIG